MKWLLANLRKAWGCLLTGGIILLLLAAVTLVILDSIFNLQSNALYAATSQSKAPLQVLTSKGAWRDLNLISMSELSGSLIKGAEVQGGEWKILQIQRRSPYKWGRLLQKTLNSKISVYEFDPAFFKIETSFLPQFELTTAKERLKAESAVFAITANFRDPDGKPLGLVVHQGHRVNRPFPSWTGYFFVKDGKPWFGPKSLFDSTPGELTEASQGYPSVMKNHTVFSYVEFSNNKYFDANKVTYRALAGMRQNGQIVFILSDKGGIMNVAEVTMLAQKLNLQHATLLDGGRALQYAMNFAGIRRNFHAFNNSIDFERKELETQRSPVYLTVKRKLEE